MVSVIVPLYNSEKTIAACIKSIVCQSLRDIELILVDDGSNDDGGKICDHFALTDSRIRVIHQPNRGRTEARWAGVGQCRGEWISFVDSDDTLPASALYDLYAATGNDIDIVLGNGYTLPGEKRSIIPMDEFRHMAVRGEGTIGVPWGSLYRRTVLTRYLFDLPRHIMMGEDYLFWLRLVFTTEKPVAIVRQSVYNKGEEHTSNTFVWTAEYCYELNGLRSSSIPQDVYGEYLPDIIGDRLANLFAVAVCQSRQVWRHSRYYHDILADMKALGMQLSARQRLFLALPSLRLRQLVARLIS